MKMNKHIQKIKRDRKIQFIVIIILAGFLAYIIPSSRAAAGQATFSVEPGTSSPSQGTTQTYKIYVTPAGSNMISAGAIVNIPSQLQFQSFSTVGTSFNIVSTPSGTPAVGATSFTIIAGYFPPSNGTAGTKLLIGEVTVIPSTVGSYTISFTYLKAKDTTETTY